MNDPARQFTHMQAAVEAGVSPHVCYASVDDGICITDFVDAAPFPASEALGTIADVEKTTRALYLWQGRF